MSWNFTSRGSCDPRTTGEDGPGQVNCFDDGSLKPGPPKQPNALSLGQNQFHASARWVTQRGGADALLGSGEGELGLRAKVPIQMIDAYCAPNFILACDGAIQHLRRFQTESIALSPDPADGSHQQNVAGTITLAEPAPFETTVVVFSNEDQAVVGTPVSDKVSREAVTIPAGQRTGTFTVETNDNGPEKGHHITATISVFYAGDGHTTRLCVATEPEGSCRS